MSAAHLPDPRPDSINISPPAPKALSDPVALPVSAAVDSGAVVGSMAAEVAAAEAFVRVSQRLTILKGGSYEQHKRWRHTT
jgi:hypothetical protein